MKVAFVAVRFVGFKVEIERLVIVALVNVAFVPDKLIVLVVDAFVVEAFTI